MGHFSIWKEYVFIVTMLPPHQQIAKVISCPVHVGIALDKHGQRDSSFQRHRGFGERIQGEQRVFLVPKAMYKLASLWYK